MTAYIAQLEVSQSVPATPRRSNGSDGPGDAARADRAFAGAASGKDGKNPDVAKAREDRAKLLGYIVNAGNLDAKKSDEAPRPVSPVKPVSAAELPFVSCG
jgi:hypothetical protein